jgi:4'-phosphopantetheinyl transferase
VDGAAVEVWWLDPATLPPAPATAVAGPAERARAGRYASPADAHRSLASAWLLRTALGRRLGADPAALVLDRTCAACGEQHGRPRLVEPAGTGLEVSVSHAGDRIGVALTRHGAIGLDVEQVDPALDVTGLVRRVLTLAEHAEVAGEPAAFLARWVCKEAVLKATGHGLRLDPRTIEIAGPADRPVLRGWPLPEPPATAHLVRLSPGPGHVAALALLGADPAPPVRESSAEALLSRDDPTGPR